MPDSDHASSSNRGHPSAEERRLRRLRLSRIRKAIQQGDYENDLKVSVATDRVFERLVTEAKSEHAVEPASPRAGIP